MNDPFDPLVFIDVETTGLGRHAHLLEIAAVVTDSDLRVLGEPVSIVLPATDTRLEAMDDIAKTMHRNSGLWQECRMASGTLEEAEDRFLEYVRAWAKPQTAPMCGSTIWFDRRLLERDMPSLEAYCKYRTIDVSGVKELARRWNPGVLAALPEHARAHRALPDIHATLAELSHYREYFLRTVSAP